MLLNNLSSCFYCKGVIDEADKFNDMALMEDPGYGRAHFRKCTILEKKGQYQVALGIAEQCLEDYKDEMEMDESNIKMIPKFEEIIGKLKVLLP